MKKILLTILVLPILAHAQIITTIAGNGYPGYSGDGGPAIAAMLSSPDGIALFGNNLYVGEMLDNRVRKIDLSTGIITTFAGTGIAGYSGDSGSATSAQLYNPYGLAVDAMGNVYIADEGNAVVRKVDTSGTITTFAGNGISGYSGDGGLAIDAEITDINGISPDRYGNVYIADQNNVCIRKVDTAGIISTIAGTPLSYGYGGDGGPATSALFDKIPNVYADTIGNVYIADFYNNRLRKIDTSGIINTIAGIGVIGYTGDGGPGDAAECYGPLGIYVDGYGNVIFCDDDNNVVRKINTSGIISTIAGTGTAGYSGDGGPAILAGLSGTAQVVGDGAGHLYICDYFNNAVREVIFPPTAITGTETVCQEATITLSDSIAGGTWSCGNTAIATIGTSTGIVTGLAAGTAIITYTANDSAVTVTITVNVCSTGINNIRNTLATSVTVFPDPNHGVFTLSISSAYNEDGTIVITNMLGQIVKELLIPTNIATQIQLHDVPGIYFVTVITEQGKWREKITIQ